MAQVFITTLQHSLPGISWPMIEVLAQLRSPIQCRMRFLDLYEANFDKLRLIMDVSFWPTPTVRATHMPLRRTDPIL